MSKQVILQQLEQAAKNEALKCHTSDGICNLPYDSFNAIADDVINIIEHSYSLHTFLYKHQDIFTLCDDKQKCKVQSPSGATFLPMLEVSGVKIFPIIFYTDDIYDVHIFQEN